MAILSNQNKAIHLALALSKIHEGQIGLAELGSVAFDEGKIWKPYRMRPDGKYAIMPGKSRLAEESPIPEGVFKQIYHIVMTPEEVDQLRIDYDTE